ncbi:MAG TPA: NAD(P)-dependent oxidoreductase [Enteractinococcus sp.]
MMTDTLTVGFVGLGNMGGPMAINVAKAGFPLVLVDADANNVNSVAQTTGGVVGTREDLANCDVVVMMLPTSKIVATVLFGNDGEDPVRFKSGAVVVDMSSSDPKDTVLTGERLVELGVEMVDAPVSGGIQGATDGTLAIMLGGNDQNAIDKATPVIEAMSRVIRQTGPLGSGHAAKALNNYIAATAFASLSEALAVGEEFGLEQQTLLDIVEASTGQSWNSTNVAGPHIVQRQFSSGFALPLITKDIQIAAKLADSLNLETPVLKSVENRFSTTLDELGNVDHTLAYKQWFLN